METRRTGVTPLLVAAAGVSALGLGLEPTWNALLHGHCGIRPVKRFATDSYVSPYAACVPGLEEPQGRSRMHPLLDALLDDFPRAPADTLLFAATAKGGIDVLEQRMRGREADMRDVPLARLAELGGKRLGLRDPGVVVSAACASSTLALGRAAAAIASGRAHCALVLCLDLVSEFIFSGFSALRALSPKPCRPFDAERDGMSIGEGAAALLLASPQRAESLGIVPLARVLGWGAADDAHHLSAPDREGRGLQTACAAALHRAGLEPQHIAAVCAHGTGTVYNDLMELKAFRAVFGSGAPPLHSVKGALGHCMGAAGGLEAALCCMMLRDRRLPPTLGLAEPEPLGRGLVSARARDMQPGPIMSANSGFSGINAAVILDAPGGTP